MGRKAKLKKIRQDQSEPPNPPANTEPTQFVKKLQRQGYNLQQVERSPEIPKEKPEPQV